MRGSRRRSHEMWTTENEQVKKKSDTNFYTATSLLMTASRPYNVKPVIFITRPYQCMDRNVLIAYFEAPQNAE